MERYREGDQISIQMYLVRKRGDGTCDRAYNAVGQTATLVIVRPDRTDSYTVTVTNSDDASRAVSMIVHTIPAADTQGARGRWLAYATVDADQLTFGPVLFEVVAPGAEIGGSCA